MTMLAVDCQIMSRPHPRETECGDCVSVTHEPERCTVAVADGLGHGPRAAEAAKAAVDFIADHPWDDLRALLARADQALHATRGAAVTVLRFDLVAHTMTYAGIGNVELTASVYRGARPVNGAGYLGGRLRKVPVSVHAIADGDVLAVFTDGVSSRFTLQDFSAYPASETARAILTAHAKSHDDATCVVIRLRASASADSSVHHSPRRSP
jgi:serine/threonine protein phosphatase PrpC